MSKHCSMCGSSKIVGKVATHNSLAWDYVTKWEYRCKKCIAN